MLLRNEEFVLGLLMLGIFCILVGHAELSYGYSEMRTFVAHLSGLQEVPPNNSTAIGEAWFNQTGNNLWYKVTVSGLDKVMGAHIHNGVAGQIGEPIITLFHTLKPTGLLNGILTEGNFSSTDHPPVEGFINKMDRGEMYVNVHTETYPIGEIRGQISVSNANTSMERP